MYSMKLNILIFKNVLIGCFTQPQFSDIEPEKAAVQLARSLTLNEDEKIDNQYKNLEMYYLGEFDDETGTIQCIEPKKLLVCGEVIKARLEKEGKEYVESIPTTRS